MRFTKESAQSALGCLKLGFNLMVSIMVLEQRKFFALNAIRNNPRELKFVKIVTQATTITKLDIFDKLNQIILFNNIYAFIL